ncbi:ribosome small subunit-dependent GTPase A [Candidatus Omnitrophota bacterium]
MVSEIIKKIKLEDLGYNNSFENNRGSVIDSDLTPARIIAEHKELYIVRNETSVLYAKITGKMMFQASSREDYPAVGDWVLIKVLSKDQAHIYEILPRMTVLKRKSADRLEAQIIASNIDIAFVVQAPDRDYNLNRFERYFALAKTGKIKPAIVLNKTDLISNVDLEAKLSEIKKRFKNTDVYATSVVTGVGINGFREAIKKGLTYCFIGSSGVGKSSIINALLGERLIKTGEISCHTSRGKHITTHRELFILESGGLLIDNPGLREVGLLDSSVGMEDVFSDIYGLSKNCRFSNCTHQQEPGCAVLDAVKTGTLDNKKYNNYIKLLKEDEYNSMTALQKREKDRNFGQFIKTAKKQFKKYKPDKYT